MGFYRQYTSSIKRIYIEKRRNPAVCCCEYLSHLIIFIFLLGGYSLSKILSFEQENYAKISISFPPNAVQGQLLNETTFSTSTVIGTVNQLLKGPIPIPTFDEYILLTDFLSSQTISSRGLITSTSFGGVYANLLYKGSLHFAPTGSEVSNLINYLNTTFFTFKTVTIFVHDSESDGVKYIQNNLDNPAFAFIILREISPTKVNYVIRQNYTVLPNTNSIINQYAVGLDTNYQDYFISGFLTLQRSVDQWAFQYTGATETESHTCHHSPPTAIMIPFPTPSYKTNPFYSEVGFLLGLAIAMASLYPVSRTVKTIVEEKETKMRELMKIMGLQSSSYQMAWSFVAFILFTWISISETFLTTISFLNKSNKVIVFAYFFLFALSEITFSFLISVFFSNSKLASIVAPVILFAALLPKFIFINTNGNEAYQQKYAASLLSPTALSFGADIITSYEQAGIGVQFSNISDGNFSFASSLQMMIVDFFLYGILAWYFDLVLPQEYGTPEHPLFFLHYSYWIRAWRDFIRMFRKMNPEIAMMRIRSYLESEEYTNNILELTEQSSGNDTIEPIANDQKSNVRVLLSNIRKRFSDGKVAVKSVSCAFIEGQITCLLGSNGAGKTTTISILTGLIQASAGKVAVYGNDLINDLHDIRQITGVCPQQNVLFPSLTVTEHLRFFGSIKGLYGRKLTESVDKCINDVGLTEKRYVIAKSLSGGMKRKLSLAIALIGDPKFVLLDEPTSGMDPYSRRSTWDILQKTKADRVVLLTTHFMDEADTLADRIIILSEGRLRCSGSSLFLKTRFGAGYMLTLSVASQENILNGNEVDNPIHPSHSDVDNYGVNKDIVRKQSLKTSNPTKNSLNESKLESNQIEEETKTTSSSNLNISYPQKSMIVSNSNNSSNKISGSASKKYESHPAIDLVCRVIPKAVIRSYIAGEIVFQLPLDSLPMFAELFRLLRDESMDHGIHSYGISITSLEQVFIRLAEEAEIHSKTHKRIQRHYQNGTDNIVLNMNNHRNDVVRPNSVQEEESETNNNAITNSANVTTTVARDDNNYNDSNSDIDDDDDDIDNDIDDEDEPPLIDIVFNLLRKYIIMISTNTYRFLRSVFSNQSSSDTRYQVQNQSQSMAIVPAAAVVPQYNKSFRPSSSREIELVNTQSNGIQKLIPMQTENPIDPSVHESPSELLSEVDIGTKQNENISMNRNNYISVSTDAINTNQFSNSTITIHYHTTIAYLSNLIAIFQENIIVVQLSQLLKKRVITVGRDLKGLFFQIIFPAIQIILVLAILTISFNPAGHTLRLNLTTYSEKASPSITPLMMFQPNSGNQVLAYSIDTTGSLDKYNLESVSANTSYDISENFLENYKSAPLNRLGGIIFDDLIPVNITVDWTYVKDNAAYIEKLAIDALNLAGVNISQAINFLNFNIPPFSITFSNNTIRDINRAKNFLDKTFNTSDIINQIDKFFNISKVIDSTTSSSQTAISENGLSGTVNVGKISFDDSTKTFTLSDLSISFPSLNLTVSESQSQTITISTTQLISLLPDGIQVYTFKILSPYTVMHNSSSEHAVAFYHGQLVKAAYRICSPAGASLYNTAHKSSYSPILNNQNHRPMNSSSGGSGGINNNLEYYDHSYAKNPYPRSRNLQSKSTGTRSDTMKEMYLRRRQKRDRRRLTEPSGGLPQYLVKNHPLPLTLRQTLEIKVILALFASLFILIPLCYIPSVFCVFIVQERASKCKHLQIVSGVSPHLYWWATYIWDVGLYTILAFFVMLGFLIYGKSSAIVFIGTSQSFLATILLLLTYGISSIALSYLYSLFFDNYSTAQISIMAINFFTGFIFVLAYYIMTSIQQTRDFGNAIVNFFRFFPPYNVGEGLVNLSTNYFVNTLENGHLGYLSWTVTGRNIVFMLVEAIGYFSIMLILEASWFNKMIHFIQKYRYRFMPSPPLRVTPEDEDVTREAMEVSTSVEGDYMLLVKNVIRSYLPGIFGGKIKHALRGVSLGIKTGERFGLLGINGAGKTTLLNILTGDIQPTSGTVAINDLSLSEPAAKKLIGYCPQVDPLLDLMTGREILWFFGRIRGLSTKELEPRVDKLIAQVGLKPFANRPCGRYSGGNKRKLSLAIALIGDPKVLLLDEPSTGMDPESRRKMWTVIQAVSQNRSVILVSHSMEECEALCTRISILVSGRVQCLGSSQHLKSKYGAGYQVEIRCKEIENFVPISLPIRSNHINTNNYSTESSSTSTEVSNTKIISDVSSSPSNAMENSQLSAGETQSISNNSDNNSLSPIPIPDLGPGPSASNKDNSIVTEAKSIEESTPIVETNDRLRVPPPKYIPTLVRAVLPPPQTSTLSSSISSIPEQNTSVSNFVIPEQSVSIFTKPTSAKSSQVMPLSNIHTSPGRESVQTSMLVPMPMAMQLVPGAENMPAQLRQCLQLCASILPWFEVLETHGYYFRIRTETNTTAESIDLVSIFESIEKYKESLGIIDYNVSQASLEQIFIHFAKEQEEERGNEATQQSRPNLTRPSHPPEQSRPPITSSRPVFSPAAAVVYL